MKMVSTGVAGAIGRDGFTHVVPRGERGGDVREVVGVGAESGHLPPDLQCLCQLKI
jgi:hypothetical protein